MNVYSIRKQKYKHLKHKRLTPVKQSKILKKNLTYYDFGLLLYLARKVG